MNENENENGAGVTVRIGTEPSYYGSDVTNEEAVEIALRLAGMVRDQFPGADVDIVRGEVTGGSIKGDDDAAVEEVRYWIQENWTAAL